jgi:hypothetical protein
MNHGLRCGATGEWFGRIRRRFPTRRAVCVYMYMPSYDWSPGSWDEIAGTMVMGTTAAAVLME